MVNAAAPARVLGRGWARPAEEVQLQDGGRLPGLRPDEDGGGLGDLEAVLWAGPTVAGGSQRALLKQI